MWIYRVSSAPTEWLNFVPPENPFQFEEHLEDLDVCTLTIYKTLEEAMTDGLKMGHEYGEMIEKSNEMDERIKTEKNPIEEKVETITRFDSLAKTLEGNRAEIQKRIDATNERYDKDHPVWVWITSTSQGEIYQMLGHCNNGLIVLIRKEWVHE